MKKKLDFLSIILAAITGASLFAAMLFRAFLPRMIVPKFDSIAVIALVLAALLLDFYIAKKSCRTYFMLPLYGALIFGLFPWLACFVLPLEALKLALLGAVCFTAVTWLFDSMTDRLSSGPAARLAPIFSALGLFLAFQCLMGII